MKIDLDINGERLLCQNERGVGRRESEMAMGASLVEVVVDYNRSKKLVEVKIERSKEGDEDQKFISYIGEESGDEIEGIITWQDYKLHITDDGPFMEYGGEGLTKVYFVEVHLPVDDVPRATIKTYGIDEL